MAPPALSLAADDVDKFLDNFTFIDDSDYVDIGGSEQASDDECDEYLFTTGSEDDLCQEYSDSEDDLEDNDGDYNDVQQKGRKRLAPQTSDHPIQRRKTTEDGQSVSVRRDERAIVDSDDDLYTEAAGSDGWEDKMVQKGSKRLALQSGGRPIQRRKVANNSRSVAVLDRQRAWTNQGKEERRAAKNK